MTACSQVIPSRLALLAWPLFAEFGRQAAQRKSCLSVFIPDMPGVDAARSASKALTPCKACKDVRPLHACQCCAGNGSSRAMCVRACLQCYIALACQQCTVPNPVVISTEAEQVNTIVEHRDWLLQHATHTQPTSSVCQRSSGL